MTEDVKWVRIERVFDAPIDTVWAMWATAEGFARWYGPTGATIPVCEMDVTVGGRRKICMRMDTPKGEMEMWFVGEFREIAEPHRLVYTESMSDAEGNVLSPQSMGMPEDHPEVTEIIVELEELGDRTRMRMIHVGVPAGSGGEAGWTMAIDKLAELLSA